MSQKPCPHPDIRKFNGIRCCLACGKAVFEASSSNPTLHTVDATGRYKHTRLNYELGREIRLISLLPGDSDDALRCEIAHVNLEDDPVYDAVSYTWATEDGDASLSSTIECIQGGFIPITRNCDIVLRQLRRPGIRRTLWVDAICIDQANMSERNHQVGLMDLIYRGARCVIICISDRVRRATSPDYAQLFRCLQDTHLLADEALEMFDVTSLLHLLSLRYFGRGWVIQEVALARAAFLIVNGHELSLNSSVMDRLKRVCKRHRLELPGVMMWTPGHRFEYDVLACLYAGMRCNVSDPLDHVFAVLSLMEPQARSLISIDYSLSKESVYTTAIIAIMATRHNLDVILYVSQNKPYETHHGIGQCLTEENLRSYLSHASANDLGWVDPVKPRRLPQFDEDKTGPWQSTIEVKMMSSLEYHQHPLTLEGISCAIEITQPKLCCLLPRFSIRAHYLDNIEKPAAFAVDFELDQPGFPIQYKGALMSWGRTTHHTLAKYFQVDHPVSTAYPDMVSDKDVVKFQAARSLCTATSTENVRTVSADHDLYVEHLLGFFCALHRPFDIYAEDLVERIHVGGEYPHLNTEDLIEFFSTVIEHMLKNWVFSSHYSLGLGPRTMKKCDEIWAIDGANTPFVLRKTGTKQYKIVGPCYLWAALELDAWNPGTKKGRWGPDVERPTFEQTRMIEIH